MSVLTAPVRDNVVIDESQRRQAGAIQEELAGHLERLQVAASPAGGSASTSAHQPLPPGVARVLGQVLEAMAAGRTVTISAMPEELTTTVAAQQLGISRPTLMKFIREGRIAAHKVGSHHRVKASDVNTFRRNRLASQRASFDELNRLLDDED